MDAKKSFLASLLLFSVSFYIQLYAQIPIQGLIVDLPFNGNAIDESGNGNNGTVYNAKLTIDRCENPGSAYEFDGLRSQIFIPNSTMLDTATRTSLCAWIKPVAFYGVGNNSIIDKGYYFHESPYYQYHLGITGTDWPNHPATFVFSVSIDMDFNQILWGPWIPGLWYFVVGTYDGVDIKLYVNATLVDSMYKPGVIDRFGNDIYIGSFRNFPNAFTPGVIDDIKIYNRALSQEEILQLYRTNCILGVITGETEVCQGQMQVPFFVQPFYGATNYAWNYSGTGATIYGNDDYITIDFADNATNGLLTVTVTGEYITTQTRSVPVFVNTLPLDAGTITGDLEVCQGQNGVFYSVSEIQNATSYAWTYSGSGALISGNSDNINIDFSNSATSGNLTVSGANSCGTGNLSAPFPVAIDKLPGEAGEITGVKEACQNQNDIIYSTSPIENATDYVWNYNGTGATIRGSSESVVVSFSSDATTGNLTVFGNNTCGNGIPSATYPITVSSCPEYPPFHIPNSFSPNGDGVNDVFFIRGLTENSTLLIFDRDGNKLFESFNYQNDWDGKDKKGHVLESGTYWYIISLSGFPGEFKGFVYLKR